MRSDDADKHSLLCKVNFFDNGAEVCAMRSWDSMACLSSKVISEVFSVFELQIGRDEILEIKSGNEMLESLRLVRVKDGLIGLG